MGSKILLLVLLFLIVPLTYADNESLNSTLNDTVVVNVSEHVESIPLPLCSTPIDNIPYLYHWGNFVCKVKDSVSGFLSYDFLLFVVLSLGLLIALKVFWSWFRGY